MKRIYINGNYQVTIYEDGTKTRISLDGTFEPNRIETLDINISNKCNVGCDYCYINATPKGAEADLGFDSFEEMKIPKHTELALNYNGFHKQLDNFLDIYFYEYIINLTVNNSLLHNKEELQRLQGWIDSEKVKGIGVSTNKFIPNLKLISTNIVYHTIVGITPVSEIVDMLKANQKVLILGYKQMGRGITNPPKIWDVTPILEIKKGILSFDNLALEQLDIQAKIPSTIWDSHYMGDDGTTSFYIDLVSKTFSKSSIETVKYDINGQTVAEMYEFLTSIQD